MTSLARDSGRAALRGSEGLNDGMRYSKSGRPALNEDEDEDEGQEGSVSDACSVAAVQEFFLSGRGWKSSGSNVWWVNELEVDRGAPLLIGLVMEVSAVAACSTDGRADLSACEDCCKWWRPGRVSSSTSVTAAWAGRRGSIEVRDTNEYENGMRAGEAVDEHKATVSKSLWC